MKGLCILGSTGSIGVNTLDVAARYPEKYGFSVKKKIILPEPLNVPMWLMLRDL